MIVLVNPWSTPSRKTPLPMSLLALGGALEGVHDYAIVDGNLDPDPVSTIVALHGRTPLTALAVTVMPGPQLATAVTLSRAVRRALPRLPIVWGGYFPSQHADVCLKDGTADVCVIGQGEQTMRELADAITGSRGWGSVAGVAYWDAGRMVRTAARPLVALDDLPEWPHHRVSMPRYLPSHYMGRRVASHHSSFGCPHACSFCAVVSIVQRKWVAESPERVGRVLERMHGEYGADAVQFHDMDFFISEPRTAAIAERLQHLGMPWWALGRVDELMRYKTATWDRMQASGLKMVFCGAESGSSETLARMNKGGTSSAEQTVELAARMKTYGVVPEFSFVVGNPPDPEGDLAGTLEFIRRVKTVNPASEIILYTYSPVPLEGAYYDAVQAQGFCFPETLDEWVSERWQTFALRRDPRTPFSRGSVRQRVRDFESVLNAFYPTVTDTRLTPARRALLKTLASVRYRFRWYAQPLELRALQRLLHYQRPETTGF